MHSDAILAVSEEVMHLVGRLDARISASPLAEAWQVRACFMAAETLADVDRTPTRVADILGLMSGTALPSPCNYLPALAGYGHWRRCMAQIELSDLASRLVGRTLTSAARAAEAQADWDFEDQLPPAGRRSMGTGTSGEVDHYALEVGRRALRLMREEEVAGSRLHCLARGMQKAIRADPDPDFFARAHEIRMRFEEDARRQAEFAKGALPSPADPGKLAAIEEQMDEFIASVSWEKPSHLGTCFAVLPDRLQDLGVTTNRLSCLTGATKRLGFEGLLDERAFRGFLNQLAREARAGLALLDSLEQMLADFARSPEAKFDSRSQLPEIVYAFLLYPAVDTVWLQTALDLQDRIVRKFVRRLADGGLIAHWAERKVRDVTKANEVRLWTAARFERDFALAMKRPAASPPPRRETTLQPSEMIERVHDVDISVPMSVVFERFEKELIDLDREFGRFFEPRLGKNRASQAAVQRDFGRLATQQTRRRAKALYGA